MLSNVKPGNYALFVRTVDQNGQAQPQPRPQDSTGRTGIPTKIIKVLD